nr:RNA-directed DNA polymerase, eukaryota, reverse transcriptase zinc-binding domain protein [Tanacetum cinerariifolium]
MVVSLGDEISNAVWGCGENKSPGPDGFTFEFFHKFGTVVGPDFYTAVQWFFDHGSFSIGCNYSFIALILKSLDPKVISDYRPISLIGSLYKVVTKILATRLSTVISDLISDVQTTFLPNRQILDGPFIINEILSRCKQKNQHAMVFKVDFAKAYDSIRWDYLDDVLKSFGFGSKWCSWIRDDAVFIGEWSQDNLKGIMNMLRCFSLLLGLSINIKKSHLLGVGIPDSIVNATAESFGCSVIKTPFKYLGVMVGGNMSLVKSWHNTVEKLKQRLSKWKLKTLSIGGRLTLLKSVLGSSPIYNMSLFKVPKTVLNMMEGNGMRTSFWNDFWIGDTQLKNLFPRLYALESIKESSVADKLQAHIASSFRRAVRGGVETQQLNHLLDLLGSVILSNMEDR